MPLRRRPRPVLIALAASLAVGAAAASVGVADASAPTAVVRYVALGNSYSSGDGAFNAQGNARYFHASNIPGKNECHRSANAFPEILAHAARLGVTAANFVFAACAEARVANFVKTFPSFGDWGEGPQLDAIAPAGAPSASTGLVTVTVGGTDVGLYADVLSCVHAAGAPPAACAQAVNGRLGAGLKLLRSGGRVKYDLSFPNKWRLCPTCRPSAPDVVDVPALATLFAEIHQRAPGAKVLVLGYPSLVPPGSGLTCQVGTVTRRNGRQVRFVLEPADLAFITKVLLQLNQVITESVNTARGAGVPVTYVSTYGAFRGHGPCDTASPSQLYLNTIRWLHTGSAQVSAESLHPNALGQTALANLVLQHL